RHFSITPAQPATSTHYDTLSISRNASKGQIKLTPFQLSKQFHPDVNKDPQAREKFVAFSEAYAVLGDDRQLRSYDRSLASTNGVVSDASQPGYYSYHATTNEVRRRSANYAWERRHRPPPGYTHPSSAQRSQPSGDPHIHRTAASGFRYHPPRTGWKETELDRVNRVSGLGRAAQLVGIFVFIAFVGTLGKS
ncbi:DnaJ-domain-containing protein, partial [Lactarius indigo]